MSYSLLTRYITLPFVTTLRAQKFFNRYVKLMRFEDLSLEEQKSIQWKNFQDIFSYCVENIPFYKDKFRNINREINNFNDLIKIPILTKREIESNFPDKITKQISNKSDWEYKATGGTTDRLMIVSDQDLREHHYARKLRTMHIAGECYPGRKRQIIPPDVCSITCGTRETAKELLLEDFKKCISDKSKIFNNLYVIGQLIFKKN